MISTVSRLQRNRARYRMLSGEDLERNWQPAASSSPTAAVEAVRPASGKPAGS